MFYRRPQTVIVWVFKQAGPNTVSYRKGWSLQQAGVNLVAPQILNRYSDACLNKLQEHHPYAKGLGSLNKLARSSSMGEGLLIYKFIKKKC